MMRLNLSRRLREVGDVERARGRGRDQLENKSVSGRILECLDDASPIPGKICRLDYLLAP